MSKNFITAYNRTQKSIKDVSCVKYTAPSKVKQSLSYATDINEIYKNYCKTGNLPLNGQQPIYDENFVKYDSLIEAQKLCAEASEYFNGLPASIKNQYGNDLRKFVKALNAKDDFLVKQGLLKLPEPAVDINIKDNAVSNVVPDTTPNEHVNTAQTD